MGLLVAGALHWVVTRPNLIDLSDSIFAYFDLSTHEYREVGFPKFDRATDTLNSLVETVAMRGKLCLSVYYDTSCRFVLWVMEDYGVVESWTKKLDIGFPDVPYHFGWSSTVVIRLLYSYDNGGILFSWPSWFGEEDLVKMFMYGWDEKKLWSKYFHSHGGCRIFSSFVYTETLVSPMKHC